MRIYTTSTFTCATLVLSLFAAVPAQAQSHDEFFPYTYDGDFGEENIIRDAYNVQRATDIDTDGKPKFTEYYQNSANAPKYGPYGESIQYNLYDPRRLVRAPRFDGRRPPADGWFFGNYNGRMAYMQYVKNRMGNRNYRPLYYYDSETSGWVPYSESVILNNARDRSMRTFGNYHRRLGGTRSDFNSHSQM